MVEECSKTSLNVHINMEGHKPSLSLSGNANEHNFSRVIETLDKLAKDHGNCVSLDLERLESMDSFALGRLAGSAGAFADRQKRLHLKSASSSVKSMLDKHMVSEVLCCENCNEHCKPESCAVTSTNWEVDVFTLPCELNYGHVARERVDKIVSLLGYPKCYRNDVQIAVGEAVTNAIKYGHSHDGENYFTVSCLASSEKISITVSDNGPGFCIDEIPGFDDLFESESGRGIFCMNVLMDEVEFCFDSGTTVHLSKRR